MRAEHAKYLADENVIVPALSPHNRAPEEADVRAAHADIGSPDSLELCIYLDRSPGDSELTIGLRGDTRLRLQFFIALAKRCGQLYMFPFPHDGLPGIVVDPADDLEGVLRRMDPDTRERTLEYLQESEKRRRDR